VNKIVLYDVESNVWEKVNTTDSLIHPSFIDEEETEVASGGDVVVVTGKCQDPGHHHGKENEQGGCFG